MGVSALQRARFFGSLEKPMQRWTRQTPFTDPGNSSPALAAIGGSPESAVEAIQGLLIHGEAVEHYGLNPDAFSRETLPVGLRLSAILADDDRPLGSPRPPQSRALVTCRDYAVLLCAAMRQRGRPSRVRCGFASYLGGAPWEDHWLCELWSGDRWQRMDGQLDPVLRDALGTEFPSVDVPADAFLTADQAWIACRSGRHDPAAFGHGEARGLWFAYVNLARDRLALDDLMTSEWDEWRVIASDPPNLTDAMLAAADELALAGADAKVPGGPPWRS